MPGSRWVCAVRRIEHLAAALHFAGAIGTWRRLISYGPPPVSCTISADAQNDNIFTQCASSPASAVAVTLTINAGIYVYSSNSATPALTTGSGWPAGSTITPNNNGVLVGAGVAGGSRD